MHWWESCAYIEFATCTGSFWSAILYRMNGISVGTMFGYWYSRHDINFAISAISLENLVYSA